MKNNIRFFIVGSLFGIVFLKAQIISWFRIQEMFRFQSFHMYGIIGSAVITGLLSVFLIRKFNIKTMAGEEVVIPRKPFNKGTVIGGLLFGLGWGLTGSCPGPIFAQLGMGVPVAIVVLLSAMAGTWVYGLLRDRLPH
ncbi:MAG TPA: YeeE/YedE thiosulfate transporter family protein [Flavihumibacter sp.]|nr:YeeE/YedE thiosulfate transporter family protein [Flavihumibacter sp.]HPZ87391.1 YeeE/YedE thiosulfate transporter family protein [Flavihumibacter sp.]HQD09793.1 YeeE/YedE thiosulfate transporter family protein [Flavihumibacter sp.]